MSNIFKRPNTTNINYNYKIQSDEEDVESVVDIDNGSEYREWKKSVKKMPAFVLN